MEARTARALLQQQRRDALERLEGLGLSFADIVEASRDSNIDDEHDTEGVTVAASRSQVAAFIGADQRKLAEIDAALARVEAGDYGICVRCGSVIPDGRLEARPATATCVRCAQQASSSA
ncbi:TraR/DksA family transcriptional regulator [Dermacoccaceae bacterium W4C1]